MPFAALLSAPVIALIVCKECRAFVATYGPTELPVTSARSTRKPISLPGLPRKPLSVIALYAVIAVGIGLGSDHAI